MELPGVFDQPTTEFDVKGGRHLRLTMIEPELRPNGVKQGIPMMRSGVLWQLPTPLPTKPTRVFGVYVEPDGVPARFRVEGLPVGVEFTITPVPDGDGVGIGAMTVTPPPNERLTQDHIDRIPVATLTKQAMTTAGVLGTYFPAGYDGPYVDEWNGLVLSSMWITTSGAIKEDSNIPATATFRIATHGPAIHENGTRPLTEGEVIRLDLEGLTKRRRTNELQGDDLQAVADLWHDAIAAGTSTEQAIADRFVVSTRTARRWVNRVRAAGLIPPLDDDDKRRRAT